MSRMREFTIFVEIVVSLLLLLFFVNDGEKEKEFF